MYIKGNKQSRIDTKRSNDFFRKVQRQFNVANRTFSMNGAGTNDYIYMPKMNIIPYITSYRKTNPKQTIDII